jgi:hypothetical protein
MIDRQIVMPGEVRGCVGCHEGQGGTGTYSTAVLALGRPPADLTPPPWGQASIGFERLVQPVLDKYCVGCHDDGQQSHPPNLQSTPGRPPYARSRKTVFQPYLHLLAAGWPASSGARP